MGQFDNFTDIGVSIDNYVATIEIQRGPNNFFDAELIDAIAGALEALDETPDCRAVVLCAEGKHFCAGNDFSNTERDQTSGRTGHLYQNAVRIFRAKKPVITVVQGAAIGGGLGLALTGDFRVTCPEARFSANFAQLGFHQGFGLSVTLPRLVGPQKAARMLYTGSRVKGDEAYEMGLADELTTLDNVRAKGIEMAQEIADAAPLAVMSIRATLREGLADAIAKATDHELAEQNRLRQTEDFREGTKAVGERRKANFQGK